MIKIFFKDQGISEFKMTGKKKMMFFFPTLPSKIIPEEKEEKETQPPHICGSNCNTQRCKAGGGAASDRAGRRPGKPVQRGARQFPADSRQGASLET